jgi:hypothetical protein
MAEISAVDAESAWSLLSEEIAFPKLTTTLIALRVALAHELEHENVFAGHVSFSLLENCQGNFGDANIEHKMRSHP